MTLKPAIAQLDLVAGDLAGNAGKIVDAVRQAHARGARPPLAPELSMAGRAGEDSFLRPACTEARDDAVKGIAAAPADLKDMVVVVGHPAGGSPRGRCATVRRRRDATGAIKEGRISEADSLPAYDVLHGILARCMLDKAKECERRRASAGIRGAHRSFGKDWRYPITSKFNETAGAGKP